MIITLSPQRRGDTITVSKAGDVITINGEAFDFSSLPDGATLPAGTVPSVWIVGPVDRFDGEIGLTLILPHGPNPEPWQAFPEPLVALDGVVDLPADTVVTVEHVSVDGGTNVITTTKRWHRPDEVTTEFVPAPASQEEADHVDA